MSYKNYKHYSINLRNKIGDNFEYLKLIFPGDRLEHKDNLYYYKNCRELTGQRDPFQQKPVVSNLALESKRLYYQFGDNRNLVKLLPFIKYFETKKAMYFYSRILGNNIDYISHHYSDSEDTGEPLNHEFLEILKNIFNLDLDNNDDEIKN